MGSDYLLKNYSVACGWLVGRSVVRLVRLVCWFVHSFFGLSVSRLIDCLIGSLVGWLVGCLVG